MNSSHPRIAIVGGGLAGLVAAFRLEQRGVRDVLVVEARDTLGGRIASIDAAGRSVDPTEAAIDRFDLGPTWYWPQWQPALDALVGELGLRRLDVVEDGDMLVERSSREPAVRMHGYSSDPPSARLQGATGGLIAALRARLGCSRVLTGSTVLRLRRVGAEVELDAQLANGDSATWRADHVLLALPPRVAERRVVFEPPLPHELARRWRSTPTWMAPHAKYVAIYPTPFWREQGLSGAARSALGPLVEIHDVSMPGGHAALFGFVGVPAQARRQLGDGVLRAHCRDQFGRLFGERAATPLADALRDWATDPLVATDDDLFAGAQHAEAPPSAAAHGPWAGSLSGIGSEWSALFPGYLAGAVDAAQRGVDACLAGAGAGAATP
ncbi:putrescine oxidase [mine drainage metagenome]|uniref:Putrescine oxidase n=1 Tax=mine drainage metagenome TaxID=410659 RepID=A0A1J5QFW6_9ZZZZ